jgi:hypothetical protein
MMTSSMVGVEMTPLIVAMVMIPSSPMAVPTISMAARASIYSSPMSLVPVLITILTSLRVIIIPMQPMGRDLFGSNKLI